MISDFLLNRCQDGKQLRADNDKLCKCNYNDHQVCASFKDKYGAQEMAMLIPTLS